MSIDATTQYQTKHRRQYAVFDCHTFELLGRQQMLGRILKLLAILGFVYLSSSCGTEIGKTFGDLSKIRDAVIEISKTDSVFVNIHNGSILGVNVVNSYLNNKSTEGRGDVARKIATMAFEKYESRNSLASIYVNFIKHERKYIVLEMKDTIESFSFKPSELIKMSSNNRLKWDAAESRH